MTRTLTIATASIAVLFVGAYLRPLIQTIIANRANT
jgi:hypothetical protein